MGSFYVDPSGHVSPTPESQCELNDLPSSPSPQYSLCAMSSERPHQKPEQGQELSQPLRSHKPMTKAERRDLQEKQRAAKAAAKASGSAGQTNKPASKQPDGGGEKSSGRQSGKQASGPSLQTQTQHQRRGSRVSGIGGEIPRPGGGPGGNIASDLASRSINPRGVRIFSHFGLQQKSGTGKGLVHPAIVRLGLLFSDFQITGANARCLATLIAFKHVRRFPPLSDSPFALGLIAIQVIQDYTTPQNNTLSRHLMTHLSTQISHLVAARPMSVTMGNAIRQLKLEISGVDIDLPEKDVGFSHPGVLLPDGTIVG